MPVPRFDQDAINPRHRGSDVGDSFQAFLCEVVRKTQAPNVQCFPAAGRDGGIDASVVAAGARTVYEFKFIGEDRLLPAQRRWREIATRLEANISNPSGPAQSQYAPRFRLAPAVTRYEFWISSQLANQNQRDVLGNEIRAFFLRIAAEHPHLEHLSRIEVVVHDWSHITACLDQDPGVLFRWFPAARPDGLVPLGETFEGHPFRDYLYSAKLPHLTAGQYLHDHPAPEGSLVADEASLLAQLSRPDTTGVAITGIGGVGKTRLMIEVGLLAQREGWSVLKVLSKFREESLDRLFESLAPDTSMLLLIDYAETRPDFADLASLIADHNETYGTRLRFLTTCRRTYYPTIAVAVPFHADLSPEDADDGGWHSGYRRAVVRHILSVSGLPTSAQYLAVCRDVPVLAVFLSYLHAAGREVDLAELVADRDFGTWVAKRLQLTFGPDEVSRDLATLMAILPFPEAVGIRVLAGAYGGLFERLVNDGWVERGETSDAKESWASLHDVLADQILTLAPSLDSQNPPGVSRPPIRGG